MILARLEKVESLHLMGITTRQIAEQLHVSHSTVVQDLKRCRELWRKHFGGAIEDLKLGAAAQLDEVIKQAWLAFLKTTNTSLNRSAYLNTVRACIADKTKLLGLNEPVRISLEARKEAERMAIEYGTTAEEILREVGLL